VCDIGLDEQGNIVCKIFPGKFITTTVRIVNKRSLAPFVSQFFLSGLWNIA
jgi:hypothetical protein